MQEPADRLRAGIPRIRRGVRVCVALCVDDIPEIDDAHFEHDLIRTTRSAAAGTYKIGNWRQGAQEKQ